MSTKLKILATTILNQPNTQDKNQKNQDHLMNNTHSVMHFFSCIKLYIKIVEN
jgi:hypothetical protein